MMGVSSWEVPQRMWGGFVPPAVDLAVGSVEIRVGGLLSGLTPQRLVASRHFG